MNVGIIQNTLAGMPQSRLIALGVGVVVLALFAVAVYMGEPLFFFRWLVGLQADD